MPIYDRQLPTLALQINQYPTLSLSSLYHQTLNRLPLSPLSAPFNSRQLTSLTHNTVPVVPFLLPTPKTVSIRPHQGLSARTYYFLRSLLAAFLRNSPHVLQRHISIAQLIISLIRVALSLPASPLDSRNGPALRLLLKAFLKV